MKETVALECPDSERDPICLGEKEKSQEDPTEGCGWMYFGILDLKKGPVGWSENLKASSISAHRNLDAGGR